MDTDKSEILNSFFDEKLNGINQITEKIIGCSYTVSNTLGCGFLEKVYENALAHELKKARFKVLQQHEIEVYYDGIVVGKYIADLFVEGCVIVEVKAISSLDESQKAQCLNYLKATKLKIGLLINFGKPRIEIKRVAL
ncbi:MAG: GxxExxY protein [Acidobacteriota bacterium]|nr:GxxExxY protein [Acidobacteriota bacterium]